MTFWDRHDNSRGMREENEKQFPQRIGDSHRVLDVGGWHSPFNRADVVIDIMPYETRNKAGAILTKEWPEERFTKATFHQRDICETPWPFKDKEFDFVLCSHTLEDIRDPIAVCKELNRVAKAGYIEVPSRLVESTKGVERPFYCGYYHHRWLCEVDGTHISFLFKPAMLHAYRRFYFTKPWYRKVSPKYDSVGFFWEGSFGYEEKIVIDRDEVQNSLIEFKNKYRGLADLFVRKYSWLGRKI